MKAHFTHTKKIKKKSENDVRWSKGVGTKLKVKNLKCMHIKFLNTLRPSKGGLEGWDTW